MLPDTFSSCVLYTTATCNLKCKYCYIDKSDALQKIDKELQKSFEGDYYFNFMKDSFQQNSLTDMEFWGGEPTYGFSRLYPTLKLAIPYFPHLANYMFSTNLTTSTVIDDITNLCQFIMDQDIDRPTTINIQLSLDGPVAINDLNRGTKSTLLFTQNFAKLCKTTADLTKKYKHLTICAHFKPTLDTESLEKLQTEASILDYYQFFEEFHKLWYNISPDASERRILQLIAPNLAVPGAYTQQDGKNFYNFCSIILQIMKDKKLKIFDRPMPYPTILFRCPDSKSLAPGCPACGSGRIVVGLLPGRKYSACHNGFVQLLSDYKQRCSEKYDNDILSTSLDKTFFAPNNGTLIFSEEDYNIFINKMSYFYNDNLSSTVETTNMIRTLAEVGQIDKKYMNVEEAIKASKFLFFHCSTCIRDNYNITKSIYLIHPHIIKVLLNGAKEVIEASENLSK